MNNSYSSLLPRWVKRGLQATTLLLATAGMAEAQTLALSGTGGSTTNDVTAFVDRVEIVRAADNTVVTGAIANAGFETPAQTVGGYTYRVTGGSWTFIGGTGITYANGSNGFQAPTTPDGVQVAFIQNAGTPKTGNTISQALTLAAGNYQVRFLAAQRPYGPFDQGVAVTVGGVQVGTTTPPSTSSYTSYTSNTFTVASDGTVTLTPVVVAGLSVQYQTGDLGQPTDNQLRPFLQLVNNNSTTAVPYSSLTVRYWLTAENFMGQLVTPIDYAKLGTSFVSARYVALATPRQGAFGYIEYSFAAGAGNLNPGTDSGPIYGKAYKPDYTNFDETDDWSYQTSSSFTTNSHVTLYQNGTLVNGTEPTAVAASTALQVFSASRDASTTTSSVGVQLQVRNTGNRPVNYSDLKVRYYLTRDGASTLVASIDYAKLGASNIGVRTVNLASPVSGADAYVEFTFSSALGVFYPRTSTEDILAKIRRDDYGTLDQTNDYSFSGSTTLAVNNRFPAYLNNALVFGNPPAGAPAVVAPGKEATANAKAGAADADAAATRASLELALTGSPNPFSDQLRLQFALPTTQAYTLALYDGQGRLVQQLAKGEAQAGQAQQVEVPTQTYAAGLYLLRLTTATGTQNLKLIKQ
ncbi:MAG: T9SS type A sorting domain-containing protein [Hymenobacter sp.]|nr:MAG: T9SS type A sorting domain-containing protein [Hymenobacter sp.]